VTVRDDTQFDLSSGLPLPSLFDQDEDDLDRERDLAYGRQLREGYVEQQARRAREAYAPRPVYIPSDPADDRAPQPKPVPSAPVIPEPRRLPNQVAPVWDPHRNQWSPSHLYGRKAMAHLYRTAEEQAVVDITNRLPLPSLTRR
jgi:hypothetical protein